MIQFVFAALVALLLLAVLVPVVVVAGAVLGFLAATRLA